MFPKDVIRLIVKKCDLKTQVRCRLLNKYWYSDLDDVYFPTVEINIENYDTDEEFHPDEEFDCVENDLDVNSFDIKNVQEIYIENINNRWECQGSLLGKINNIYFYLEDSGGGTPGCCEWQKRYIIFSRKLINLIRFGLNDNVRKELLKRCLSQKM